MTSTLSGSVAHSTQLDYPMHRAVTVYVTGGLDGAFQIMTMLRARDYQVRDLDIDVREGIVESKIGCTVRLTSEGVELLLSHLRRIPLVVSAEVD